MEVHWWMNSDQPEMQIACDGSWNRIKVWHHTKEVHQIEDGRFVAQASEDVTCAPCKEEALKHGY